MYRALIFTCIGLYAGMLNGMDNAIDDSISVPTAQRLMIAVDDSASIQNLSAPLLQPSNLALLIPVSDEQPEVAEAHVRLWRQAERERICGCRMRNFLIGTEIGMAAIFVAFFIVMKKYGH